MSNVKSYISSKNGRETLFVNGSAVEGMAYMIYYTEKNHYADFASAGYRLYSLPVFFGDGFINEISHLPPFKKGIFVDADPDFEDFDRDVRDILSARHDAYIFPRVNVSLPTRWESEHPDELNDTGSQAFPDCRRACFSSDAWAEEIKRCLSIFIAHIEESDYAEHIVGYQIAGGQTEEWMSHDIKGSQGKRSREKFSEICQNEGLEGTDEQYYSYLSRITAERICEFAAHVKEITDHRLVVGAFYGYTMELSARTMTHYALARVLEDKNVDFLCSPVSYACLRAAGRDHACMLPLNSLKAHGKLYFAENDTRTHLSKAPCDLPAYQHPIWFGGDKDTTLNILKMHFARALTHGHALWWFDMWGGWYDDEEYMSLMKKMRDVYVDSMDKSMGSRAELAVFIDENCIFGMKDSAPYSRVCYKIRENLGKCGAPYDIYLASDYSTVADRYKAIISLVPAETELSRNIEKQTLANGQGYLKITNDNFAITTDELRSFLDASGVFLYCKDDAVIYACDSFIFLHTAHSGEQKIDLPDGMRLREVFTGDEYSPFNSDVGKSYLFKIL